MRSSPVREKIIKALSETPLVSFACKKAGISRATFYRWQKDNKEFKDQVEMVLTHGREHISDMCEAALIKAIKDGNMAAIRMFLQHNNPRYLPMRTVYVDPQVELKVGQKCKACGYEKRSIRNGQLSVRELTDEEDKRVADLFKNSEVAPCGSASRVIGHGSEENNRSKGEKNSQTSKDIKLNKEQFEKIKKKEADRPRPAYEI